MGHVKRAFWRLVDTERQLELERLREQVRELRSELRVMETTTNEAIARYARVEGELNERTMQLAETNQVLVDLSAEIDEQREGRPQS